MTTKDFGTDAMSDFVLPQLEENIEKMDALSKRLMAVMAHKREVPKALQGPGPDLYQKAAAAYLSEMASNPAKILEGQVEYWGKTLKSYVAAQKELALGETAEPAEPAAKDRRFSNPMWETNPYFRFLRQQYQTNTDAIMGAARGIEGLEGKDQQRLDYFTKQIVDMMSPTNFLGTNPDALEKAVETQGQSLVDGLENLVRDLEANDGEMVVTLADPDAFEVGKNLATTPGKVVFRNRMLELIQYSPTTESVHETPLIIFPPWINKFYILDLKEQNSLIKWIVDQGITLFVVSWVNPDASYRDVGLAEYIDEGYLETIEQVKSICGVEKVNAIGYCIAGTTLSIVMALLNKRSDSSLNSATLFTTMTDFSDQGEFGVFLTDDFLDGIEAECAETGVLENYYMARTFSYLRSNDLIYKPAINSYMLGQTPPAFDLLYWNGDGTNLPAKMAVEYLRWLCQSNKLADGGVELFGETLKLSDVQTPICAIACETDHIAAWKASYAGVQQMGSQDRTFILAGSGHIAGIVNPPSKVKYGHWTNPDLGLTSDDWRADADPHEGSWWPLWEKWLANRSGEQVPARVPGDATHPVLCDAPGTYISAVPEKVQP